MCCLWFKFLLLPTREKEGRERFLRPRCLWMRFPASRVPSQRTRKMWILAVFLLIPLCCWSCFVTVVFHFLMLTFLYFVKVFLPTAENLQIHRYHEMCWLCFLIYLRTFIYPFFTRGRPFPLQLLFFGTLFCVYNGFLQGYYLIYCAEYPNDWCTDIRFTSGNYSCRIPKI